MRILIVSDMHANWPALEAIQEPFDWCFCLGDIVDYGTHPRECIRWAQRHAHFAVRGNHDHGVAQHVPSSGGGGFRYLTSVSRPLHSNLLNVMERRYLASLPTHQTLTLGGKRWFLAHATPRDPMDEYAPYDAEYWEKRLANVQADFVCVGHTHQQFILQVGKTLVVNPGSAGLPRDGDWRAAYAIWTPDGFELKRVEYDLELTLKLLDESDYPDEAKRLLSEVYRSGKLPGRAEPRYAGPDSPN
jgi:putative phosphoesterase